MALKVKFNDEQLRREQARISVWDVSGRLVRTLLDEDLPPGIARVRWDGTDASGAPVASGAYFFRLESGGNIHTVRGTLLR